MRKHWRWFIADSRLLRLRANWIRRSAIPDGIPNSVPMRPRPQIIEFTKVEPSALNVSDAVAGRFRDRRFPLLKRINTQLQFGDVEQSTNCETV